jgi:hypothetical protein
MLKVKLMFIVRQNSYVEDELKTTDFGAQKFQGGLGNGFG